MLVGQHEWPLLPRHEPDQTAARGDAKDQSPCKHKIDQVAVKDKCLHIAACGVETWGGALGPTQAALDGAMASDSIAII